MKLLEERIQRDGVVEPGNILKVGSFLNHQMDVGLFQAMGREFKTLFADRPINKILTIEASGIGIACIAALEFQAPVVFAKKSPSLNLSDDLFTASVVSFTKKKNYDIMVSKEYLSPQDHILIIDDFLANGCAVLGLADLVRQAGASLEGVGIAIEKGFQDGGKILRAQGFNLHSLAVIKDMDSQTGKIYFAQEKDL